MKKSDLLFFKLTTYGNLFYHNVYSYYDEPIAFTALNDYGQVYFCYSLGLDDNGLFDEWLVVPISESNVNKLEQKDIPIIKAIKQKSDTKALLVKLCLETGQLKEDFVSISKLAYIFPKDDVYIHENVNYDGTRKHTHRIRFAKSTSSLIASINLDNASKAFSNFCRHFLNSFDIKSNFYHHDAVVGSFVYRVKASEIQTLQQKGHDILRKVSNIKDFFQALDNKKIDLRVARELFNTLLDSQLDVEFYDEESTQLIFSLNQKYILELIEEVDKRIGNYLDSTMVPQADNLDRIKKYLELTSNNKLVTADSLEVDPRQVSYYRDACRLLSLIHSYGKITPIGLKALNAETEIEFLEVIQRQFEETECGYIWMLDQGVSSMLEINEDTAADFLIDKCNGLSDSTSKRRAQTLKAWVKKFKHAS
ncbi:DUF6575 domain-containing protein [Shewanella sp.]|uniref:DUF6575 domain-containing protein n=1 Tax=Shewanella sp. TaxID=50422 RepID=UPI004048D1A2